MMKNNGLAKKWRIAMISTKTQFFENKQVNLNHRGGEGAKKRGPKMKGYPYGWLKTKKI